MTIAFPFQLEKAVEAVAVLLKLHGGPLNYLALLKMLYIADRTALGELEQTITGDCYVSMDHGPVLSNVYDLIKGQSVNQGWHQFITTQNYDVELICDPGEAELSEAELEILQQVYQDYGDLDPFEIAELTHKFPEWQDPHGSAIAISLEEILHNLGKTEAEITQIAEIAQREVFLGNLLP